MDLLTYLSQASPDEWHQVAWNWNWDSGVEVLRWIVRQPTCDRGTALLVYWYSGPRWFARYTTLAEVTDYELEDYDLAMEIEQAYLAGRYTRTEIAFDPRADQGHDWTAEYADIPLSATDPRPHVRTLTGPESSAARGFRRGIPTRCGAGRVMLVR